MVTDEVLRIGARPDAGMPPRIAVGNVGDVVLQQRSRDELEALVSTRTAEIREINRSLEAEILQRKRAEEGQKALL